MTIPAGSELRLRTLADYTTKFARKGQEIALEVEDDFVIDGFILIARGARAGGQIGEAQRKGIFGRSGFLRVDAEWVELGDQRLPIQGAAASTGKSGKTSTILAAVAVGVFSGVVTGGSAAIPANTILPAWIGKEVTVEIDGPLVRAATKPRAKILAGGRRDELSRGEAS